MSLTGNVKLEASEYQIAVAEAATVEIGASAASSLALTEAYSEVGDWTYSATAESRTGEVTGGSGFDFDGTPGLIYTGPTGAAVRCATVAGVLIDEGTGLGLGAELTDKVALALAVNNEWVTLSDEGYEAHSSSTQNFDTYVPLTEGDVLRVVLTTPSGNEADADYDVSPGNIVIA